MDNLAHTLAGLALAEAGLKRRTALGTATLAIGANLPDVDALAYLFGTGLDALAFRRGWTHGVLAMVLWPPVLALLMVGWQRLRGRRAHDGPPLHVGWLVALAAIGVWSHPLLDLLNTYGVRLLMPFSERWFYGDTLFIVDPWLWGALAVGVAWSRWRGRGAGVGGAPPAAGRPARVALAALAVYVVAMLGASRVSRAAAAAAPPGTAASRTMAAPLPVTPLRRAVVRELAGAYETGTVTLRDGVRYAARDTLVVAPDRATAELAARTPDGARFLRWSRFPRYVATPWGESTHVRIYDVRYDDGRGGWASVDVVVPRVRGVASTTR